jgi:peptidyl-prolyl cis-trans isomerase C
MLRPDRMTPPRTRQISSWQTRLTSAALGLCALGSLAACTEPPQEEPVIAMINGRSITQSEFDIRWEDLSQATRARYEKEGG